MSELLLFQDAVGLEGGVLLHVRGLTWICNQIVYFARILWRARVLHVIHLHNLIIFLII